MDRSRGQIILIAALGIAVTLVALAMITNTAIYTENLATRSTVSGQEAVAFQQSMESGTSGLLALANRYNATDHSTIRNQFETDIETLRNGTEIASASFGGLSTVSVIETTNGSRIAQNESGNFTDAHGSENWTLATDVEQTRRFQMNVTVTSLTETDPFTVNVTTDTDVWTAEITKNESAVDVSISNGTTTTCTVETNETDSIVVDLSEGRIGDSQCEFPVFTSDLSGPYNVTLENGSHAEGRYVLFVDQEPTAIEGGLADDPYSDPADGGPSIHHAVYDATLRVSVQQPDLTYETNVTIAPTESPEGEVYGVVA